MFVGSEHLPEQTSRRSHSSLESSEQQIPFTMGKERRERRLLANGSSETPIGIDDTSRRTWNKDDYADKAAQREAKVG